MSLRGTVALDNAHLLNQRIVLTDSKSHAYGAVHTYIIYPYSSPVSFPDLKLALTNTPDLSLRVVLIRPYGAMLTLWVG